MNDPLTIPNFLRRPPTTNGATMTHQNAQPQTETPQPKPEETTESLEHDAARLHREIEILEGKKKTVTDDIAAKRKELRAATSKLVTLKLKGK
jgi:hypothetical protein